MKKSVVISLDSKNFQEFLEKHGICSEVFDTYEPNETEVMLTEINHIVKHTPRSDQEINKEVEDMYQRCLSAHPDITAEDAERTREALYTGAHTTLVTTKRLI